MPLRRPLSRALGLVALIATLTLASAPAPALALDPPRPLPGYQPAFVTERQSGTWEDCTWATASMLLDKWTNVATRVDREKLRRLSGDLEGGSGLAHVGRAFAKLGIELTWSPLGGDAVTWRELLDRLRHGGGAIRWATTAGCRGSTAAGTRPSGGTRTSLTITRSTSTPATEGRAGSSSLIHSPQPAGPGSGSRWRPSSASPACPHDQSLATPANRNRARRCRRARSGIWAGPGAGRGSVRGALGAEAVRAVDRLGAVRAERHARFLAAA